MRNVKVTAICSRDVQRTKRLCETTGATGFDNYDKMLTFVDAVVICAPNFEHASFALKALNHGKHVLVEYPLCLSLEEATLLQKISRKVKKVLMVGNTIIHETIFNYLEKNQQRLGKVLSAASRVSLYSTEIADHWYMKRESVGSIFAAFHYHHIEYYRRLLGKVEWVMGRDESFSNTRSGKKLQSIGGTLVMGHLGNATSCIQWYLHSQGSGLPRCMWLNGTKSSVTIISEKPDRSRIIWNEKGGESLEVLKNDWGIKSSCQDFMDAIDGIRDSNKSLKSDIVTLKIGLAAEESSRCKNMVKSIP